MSEIDGDDEPEGAEQLALMRFFIGSRSFIPIDELTANALKTAMDDLHEMVDVEQKFDIVMENFLELETEMTTRLLKQAYLAEGTSQEFYNDKLSFNRRIINILTSTRLYIDQAAHHIGVFFPKDASKAAELKSLFSHEYDTVLAYRVMEALRNFAQHRGLPLQGMTYKTRWIDAEKDEAQLQFNVALNLIVADLDGPGGLKKSVLDELKNKGDKVDIKKMMREYVEALARVHVAFREMLKDRIDSSEKLIAHWSATFDAQCDDEHGVIGLAIGRRRPNGTATKVTAINAAPLDYIKALRARTSSLVKLSKRTVTSTEIRPKAK